MRKRFSLCKKVGVFLLTAVMCTSQLNVQAEKKYDFETEYQVVAGANGYFIAKNQKGEYGLLDGVSERYHAVSVHKGKAKQKLGNCRL